MRTFVLGTIITGLLILAGCPEPSPITADPETKAMKRTDHYNAGNNLLKYKKYAEAAEEFKKALQWVPNDRKSLIRIAFCKLALGWDVNNEARKNSLLASGYQWNETLKKWEEGNDLSRDERTAHRKKSQEQFARAKELFEEGFVYAQRAVDVRPDPDSYSIFARLAIVLGKTEDAKYALKEILANSTVSKQNKDSHRALLESVNKLEKELEKKETLELPDEFPDIKPPE